MSRCYLVRCTSAAGRAMSGIYAAGLTTTGMVATWERDRAARYESKNDATGVASRLAKIFAGTAWTAELAGVDV